MMPRNGSLATGLTGAGAEASSVYGLKNCPYNENPSRHASRDFSVCGLKMGGRVALPGCAEQVRRSQRSSTAAPFSSFFCTHALPREPHK